MTLPSGADDTAQKTPTTPNATGASDEKTTVGDNEQKKDTDTTAMVPSSRLREEAERARNAEARVTQFEKEKADADEQKKIDSGQQNEVIAGLKSQNEALNQYKDQMQQYVKSQVETIKVSMGDDRNDIEDIVGEVTTLEQLGKVQKLQVKLSVPKQQASPDTPRGGSKVDEYEQAKSKGDILGMLQNAKIL